MSVSVIIVNWNSGELLKECLESLEQFGDANLEEVIVIDNASSDGSINEINFSKAKIVRNNVNLGFAKACNIGFTLANGKFCLLLNPDTKIFPDTIAKSIAFIESHEEIEILGCRHVNAFGKTIVSCARFPTFATFLNDIFGLSKLAPKIFHPATLMTDWDHENSREVDQVIGAFMFMRKNIFRKYGYFDERFFVYFEELDYSYRVKKAGGKIYYNADFSIYHKMNGTTEKVRSFALSLSINSRFKYIKKHFPSYQFMILVAGTLTAEFFARSIFSYLSGGWQGLKANWIGYVMLFKNRNIY